MPTSELEETGREVFVLLYHHNHGVDAGVYESMEAARLGMAEVIRAWAPDAHSIELLDADDLDAARRYFEESTDEYFDFCNADIRRIKPTAVERLADAVDGHDPRR